VDRTGTTALRAAPLELGEQSQVIEQPCQGELLLEMGKVDGRLACLRGGLRAPFTEPRSPSSWPE
jgi:hypothetical protein